MHDIRACPLHFMQDMQIAMIPHRHQLLERVVMTVDAAIIRELTHDDDLAALSSTDMLISGRGRSSAKALGKLSPPPPSRLRHRLRLECAGVQTDRWRPARSLRLHQTNASSDPSCRGCSPRY